MVWGCITSHGTGCLHRITGNRNAARLAQIYEESLLGTFDDHWMSTSDVIFQEDNDSKHKSRVAQRWRAENDITRLEWPSISPDLNPIENVWDELDCRVHLRCVQPCTCDQLWAALEEEWNSLDMDYIHALYRSMPVALLPA